MYVRLYVITICLNVIPCLWHSSAHAVSVRPRTQHAKETSEKTVPGRWFTKSAQSTAPHEEGSVQSVMTAHAQKVVC